MMTITLRHNLSQPLQDLRRGLCRAWRRLQQSRQWRELRAECGVEYMIRAVEVTHGQHGWHPHVHVLLFTTRPDLLDGWQRRLAHAWHGAVDCELGSWCAPSIKRGLAITTCSDGYIAKLGLELSSTTKTGREGNLSSWQIAQRILDGDDLGEVWREYAAGMAGCHQLQWSRGLKDACGVTEPEPEEVDRPTIANIPRETWREMADEPGSLACLHSFGRTLGRELSDDDARAWLLGWFADSEYLSTKAHWKWVDGSAYLRWDTG